MFSPVIIIINKDTAMHTGVKTSQNQEHICMHARICTNTLRQSPLRIMIMKEIQCVKVGAVCVAQQL